MKFNRLALIARIDERIRAIDETVAKQHAQALADYQAKRADWLASDHPAELKAAAQTILSRIRRGQVVTHDDADAITSRSYRSPSHLFSETEPPKDPKPAHYGVLPALKDFLEAITDDEVTSSGLRDVGFRNIANILRGAAS